MATTVQYDTLSTQKKKKNYQRPGKRSHPGTTAGRPKNKCDRSISDALRIAPTLVEIKASGYEKTEKQTKIL